MEHLKYQRMGVNQVEAGPRFAWGHDASIRGKTIAARYRQNADASMHKYLRQWVHGLITVDIPG
jgi:hypothetical protein